jgi:hypothetical protein
MSTSSEAEAEKVRTNKLVLNEFGTKILNEEHLDKVAEARIDAGGSKHTAMSFKCECSNKDCDETISMSIEEYQRVHSKTSQFVVLPNHVNPELEEVVATFSNYVLVGKTFPHT